MNKGVYIPFEEHKYIGGPPTFLRNLNKFLAKQNYKFSPSLQKAKILFFPISFNLYEIYKFKLRGGKVVQRLDGIHYFSHDGSKYKTENGYLKDIYRYFADYVVFQSKYSKKQCFSVLGKIATDKHTVIINGVDKEIFYPKKAHRVAPKKTIKLITTGNFTSVDMLSPIVGALDLIQKDSPYNLHLYVIGPTAKPLRKYLERKYISYQGVLDPKEIAESLRKSDIFVYSKINPPCPNSVIEAVSTGIPVVGFRSGAMQELLPFSQDLLAFVSHKTFQEHQDLSCARLARKIRQCIGNLGYYSKLARNNSYRYSMDECAEKYSEVFQLVQRVPAQKYKIPRNTLYFVIHLINKLFKWQVSL